MIPRAQKQPIACKVVSVCHGLQIGIQVPDRHSINHHANRHRLRSRLGGDIARDVIESRCCCGYLGGRIEGGHPVG